jgi:cell division protein FtsB
MSNTAAAAVRSVRRIAAWADPVALQRARLTVVPRTRRRAPRLPFIALITALLLTGVIGLLMFNTSMQQAAFVESKLHTQADNLAARQQALQSQLQKLDDPQVIAAKAQAHGMVIAGAPAVLNVPSGKVEGTPAPANADDTPQLWTHYPKPTAVTRARKPVSGPSEGDAKRHHHQHAGHHRAAVH